MHGGQVVIVGAAETELGVRPEVSQVGLNVEASLAAVADAGLELSDIDGLATASGQGGWLGLEVAQALGITPGWLDTTAVGGCSFLLHVRHAAAAIAAGAATHVLVTHGESGRSRVGMPYLPVNPASPEGQFEAPYGAVTPYSTFTVPALRFLADRGMSVRDLAEVVVAQRAYAVGNPRAFRNTPTTVEEVLAADAIATPFTRPMCCVVTDGGGALVLTTAERAEDLRGGAHAVRILGTGEAAESPVMSQMLDAGSSHAFRASSTAALRSAGLGHSDIDHLMGYDAFAHLPLYMLEDLGFVGHGESGAFIAEGHTGRDGSLPMNTSGGGLSYTHTGQYGMFAIQESVRQLRGEAFAQVPDVEVSMVHGVGGYFWAAGTLVLGRPL
jgi:acetyl-CoA acetyltransferase